MFFSTKVKKIHRALSWLHDFVPSLLVIVTNIDCQPIRTEKPLVWPSWANQQSFHSRSREKRKTLSEHHIRCRNTSTKHTKPPLYFCFSSHSPQPCMAHSIFVVVEPVCRGQRHCSCYYSVVARVYDVLMVEGDQGYIKKRLFWYGKLNLQWKFDPDFSCYCFYFVNTVLMIEIW